MKTPTPAALLVLCSIGLAFLVPPSSVPTPPGGSLSRTFQFTYAVQVPAIKDPGTKFSLWLPVPQDDPYQEISDLHIDSPVKFSQGHDLTYGNPYLQFHPTVTQLNRGFELAVVFIATRYEHRVDLTSITASGAGTPAASDPSLKRALEPDRLVPLDGVIADLAKEQTAGDKTELSKAKSIYDYVVGTMRYDKTGDGWGRGDAVWACSSKRGNCTDFHSLLIGMMRASGIPARFEIGFPLPTRTTEGDISGYHCWAEFYLEGAGWVPVDASEASRDPEKRAYFFGAHDDNRVFFTYGRDIRLSPEQKGQPLNYFIYPYAELDGKPLPGIETHFSFKDLEAAEKASRN